MVPCRDHVEETVERFAAALDLDGLHRLAVAADLFDGNAVELISVGHEVELAGLNKRLPVLGKVAGTVAFVGFSAA